MKRSAPLQRHTPIRQRRATPRNRKTVVRLRGVDLALLRVDCWLRDQMRCVDCGIVTHYRARYDGDPNAYEMAHVKGRGAGGGDTLDNIVTKCSKCHRKEHGGC